MANDFCTNPSCKCYREQPVNTKYRTTRQCVYCYSDMRRYEINNKKVEKYEGNKRLKMNMYVDFVEDMESLKGGKDGKKKHRRNS